MSAREKVLAALQPKSRELLDEIEAFAGIEVGFRDTQLLRLAGGKLTEIEALYADHERAYVSLPDLEKINENAVVHEMLHLRRYWVNQVPMMDAKLDRGSNVELASSIDNCLEHLVIVPQERAFGFETSSYWNDVTDKFWSGHPWASLPASARRMHSLMGWLTATLATDPVLLKSVREKLQFFGLLGEAQRLQSRLAQLTESKSRTVSATLRFLQIPRTEIELVVLDIRNRKSVRSPVPEH